MWKLHNLNVLFLVLCLARWDSLMGPNYVYGYEDKKKKSNSLQS